MDDKKFKWQLEEREREPWRIEKHPIDIKQLTDSQLEIYKLWRMKQEEKKEVERLKGAKADLRRLELKKKKEEIWYHSDNPEEAFIKLLYDLNHEWNWITLSRDEIMNMGVAKFKDLIEKHGLEKFFKR